MKKSLKRILIVALVASSGVAATGQAASAQAPKPVVKLVNSETPSDAPAMMRASGIRW